MKKSAGNTFCIGFRECMLQDVSFLDDLLNAVPAGIIIVDKEGTIVFFNGEAKRMFGYSENEVLGKSIEMLLPERTRAVHVLLRRHYIEHPAHRTMGLERNLLACRRDGSEFPIEVGLGYVRRGEDMYVSAMVVDISKRKAIEAEREVLIAELKTALEKVKQLGGLLPICANCKKIRDDNGYWNQIELYIRDHSEAEFSHSICPECAKKLYPDFT